MTNKKPMTSKGKRVTDVDVEKLAREAEAGYDVPKLRRAGGRRPIGSAAAKVIPVRLDPSSSGRCGSVPMLTTPMQAKSSGTPSVPDCGRRDDRHS